MIMIKLFLLKKLFTDLVETYYHLGLEDEAKKYAKILGYNYNSSEWFEQSYKILNKDYNIEKENFKNKKSFFKKILND